MGRNLDNFSLSLVSKMLMFFFSLSQQTEYLIFISLHNILFVSKSVKMKTIFIFPKLAYMCWSHNPHLSGGQEYEGIGNKSEVYNVYRRWTSMFLILEVWFSEYCKVLVFFFFCLLSLEDYFSKLLCSCKILSILV